MKSFLQFLAIVSGFSLCLVILPDAPTPIPYEPTGDTAQRVREFIRGERTTVNEAHTNRPETQPNVFANLSGANTPP